MYCVTSCNMLEHRLARRAHHVGFSANKMVPFSSLTVFREELCRLWRPIIKTTDRNKAVGKEGITELNKNADQTCFYKDIHTFYIIVNQGRANSLDVHRQF